jgi:hypothetical protein
MNSVQGTHFNQEGHKVETPQQHSVAEKPAAPEQHVERSANKPEPVQEEKNTQRMPEQKAPTESNNHPATHDRELPAPEKPAPHERPESHQSAPTKPVTTEPHSEQKPAMQQEAAPTPPQHHASAPARPQSRPQQRPKAQPPKPNHEKKN